MADALMTREKGPSPLGTSIFVGLRAADAVLQYAILQRGWGHELISSLGGAVIPFAAPRDPSLASFGIAPYPAIIAFLAAGSSVKHIAWAVGIAQEKMPPAGAVVVSVLNTLFNTANTLLSIWAFTSTAPQMAAQSASLMDVVASSPMLMLGLGFYTAGITTELVAEVQRKIWKAKPENKGKPYGGGLWSLATNINYGGFIVWRTGAAFAAGGPVWGALSFAMFFYDMSQRAVPALDEYCTEKYGENWIQIKETTKYRLIPFIY